MSCMCGSIYRIDLTRMECKERSDDSICQFAFRIDLTRMECKGGFSSSKVYDEQV